MIGKQILNYKITKFIGDGGMATVYEAENVNLGSRVAIKIMHQHLIRQEDTRERFINEAKMMANIEHKNIAKIHDLYHDDSMIAYVMEYLEGQPLDEYIKENGGLLYDKAKNIFLQVLEGMAFAHNKKIVHRDLKPGNIFIKTDGTAKIIDFGIAKDLSAEFSKTATGMMMGTPYYMSPEQVENPKDVDWRSDIYSLGVIFFYLINGFPPFENNDTLNTIFNKIINEPLPAIGDHYELTPIIAKATQKDPKNRFQTCEEIIITINNPELLQFKDKKAVEKSPEVTQNEEQPKENIKTTSDDVVPQKETEKTIKPEKELEDTLNESPENIKQSPENTKQIIEENKIKNEIIPEKTIKKKKSKAVPVLLALLLIVAISAGAFFMFFNNKVDSWVLEDSTFNEAKIYSSVTTPEGDYIVVGSTIGISSMDWLIAKYSANGNLIWHKVIGDTGGDLAHKIIATSDGNFVIVGGTYNSNDADAQAWVVKMNTDGNFSWKKKFGNNRSSNGWDEATNIIETSNGELIFITVDDAGNKNFGVYKISLSSGAQIWYNDFGYYNDDTPYGITEASNGDFYIVGKTETSTTSKIFLVVINNDGDLMKNVSIGENSHDKVAKTIFEDDGYFYIAGYTDDDASILVIDEDATIINEKDYNYSGFNDFIKLQNGTFAVSANQNRGEIVIINKTLTIVQKISLDAGTVLKSISETADFGVLGAGFSNTNENIFLVKTNADLEILSK